MYIEGKYINGIDDMSEVTKLRQIVFGREDYSTEHLYHMDTTLISDMMAVHALAWMEGKLVGCGTLFYDGETYLIDRVGVPEEERHKKYGDFIIRMLIDRAFRHNAEKVVAYIEESTFPFLKTIGFKEVENQNGLIRCELKAGFVCKECQSMK